MTKSKLSPLQWRILDLLADLDPPFTLTGGAALAGVYLGHRKTRDLDLFWRDLEELDDVGDRIVAVLRDQDLEVERVQSAAAFLRLRISDDRETTIVDLVAEPTPSIEAPYRHELEKGSTVQVDTRREIFANKLTTLLSRSELRDLVDVQALRESGCDLDQGLEDAAKKDGGFSPLTLAWVLRSMQVEPLARSLGWSGAQAANVDRFRVELIDQLVSSSQPEE